MLVLVILIHSCASYTSSSYPGLIRTNSSSIRVYCFSSGTTPVSFEQNSSCTNTCGYFSGIESCCKMFSLVKNSFDLIPASYQCWRGNEVIQINIQHISELNEMKNVTIEDEDKTDLLCVDDDIEKYTYSNDSKFYSKWVSVDVGGGKYEKFNKLVPLYLRANGDVLLCNGTYYRYQKYCPPNKQKFPKSAASGFFNLHRSLKLFLIISVLLKLMVIVFTLGVR